MTFKKLSAFLAVFLLVCAFSCLAQGIDRLRASQSCHQEESESHEEATKACCQQALIEKSFASMHAIGPAIQTADIPALVLIKPIPPDADFTATTPSLPNLYQLQSLRI